MCLPNKMCTPCKKSKANFLRGLKIKKYNNSSKSAFKAMMLQHAKKKKKLYNHK